MFVKIFRSSMLLTVVLSIMMLFSEKIDDMIAYKPMQYAKLETNNKQKRLILPQPFKKYLTSIARMEGNNNPKAVSRFGFLGKYQFSPNTIRSMGFKVSKEEFLNSSTLQDRIMVRYLKDNRRDLIGVIRKYKGTYINGQLITESGILASAHLSGSYKVKVYLESAGANDIRDANGASISLYMKKFAGYNISVLESI